MNSSRTPRFLVPTDFSESSEHAMRYAASLGERFGATLHVMHAICPHTYDGAIDPGALPDMEEMLDAADQAARSQLDAGAVHGGEAEAKVVKVVERAVNPWEPILDYAKNESMDMIIMAMRSGSSLARFVLGSVTERVLRFAPCPVLVIEKGDRDFIDPTTMAVHLNRVVVAHDLTDKTNRALDFAVPWLQPYAPEIHMVHAVEIEVPAPYLMAGVRSVFELDPELRQRIDTMMRESSSGTIPEGWKVEAAIREGRPFEEITAFAKEIDADLLILAGESHIDLVERVMGGTVERIARHSPCPMLVV